MQIDIALTDKQIEFLDASYQYPVVFYGGARGGGKSYGLRNVVLIRALETPGIVAGVFRRTYPELRSNIIDPLLVQHPWLHDSYNKSEHLLRLDNGSVIEFNHLQRDDDVLLYQGREYDILAIEEAGQWTEQSFQRLRGSNRTSKPGVKPVTLLTGNPGGVGHQWLKRLFVDQRYRERERRGDYFFIPSRVYDCPPLMKNDPDYVSRLEAEPNEALRRAHLDGNWDVFAGQFFSEWDRDVHVIDPFVIPEHWRRFGAYDPGYFHPSAFGWFAVDEMGRVYLYRELIERGLRVDEIATLVSEYPDSKQLSAIYAGRDCWANHRDGGPTIADQFWRLPERIRLKLTEANVDRVQGAAQVRAYIAHENLPEGMQGPRLLVFSSCIRTIECIPRLLHDPKRPEDVVKIDASEEDPWAGDDTYDMLRYGLMSRPRAAQPMLQTKVLSYDERILAMRKKQKAARIKRGRAGGIDPALGAAW